MTAFAPSLPSSLSPLISSSHCHLSPLFRTHSLSRCCLLAPRSPLPYATVPRPLSFPLQSVPHPPFRSSTEISRSSRHTLKHAFPRATSPSNETIERELMTPASEDTVARLTYLEINSWHLNIAGTHILIDPIIEGPLDFGIPALYEAYKKVTRNLKLESILSEIDYIFITQSLDDHCHARTLRRVRELKPQQIIFATRNAEPLLSSLFSNVTYIEPGESVSIPSKKCASLSFTLRALKGPVLGPPWQRAENSYLFCVRKADEEKSDASPTLSPSPLSHLSPPLFSLYIEPHCVFDEEDLRAALRKEGIEGGEDRIKEEEGGNGRKSSLVPTPGVSCMILPVVKQKLPFFTLVSGQEDALKAAEILRPSFLLPMANAESNSKGILDLLVSPEGTVDTFQKLLQSSEKQLHIKVISPIPGKAIEIPFSLL